MHAAGDAKIDQPLLARIIDPSVGMEASGEYGKDAAKRMGHGDRASLELSARVFATRS